MVDGRIWLFTVEKQFYYVKTGRQLREVDGLFLSDEREGFVECIVVVVYTIGAIPFLLRAIGLLFSYREREGLLVDVHGERIDVSER